MKSWPSTRAPGSATKSMPGWMRRLSKCAAVMARSSAPRGTVCSAATATSASVNIRRRARAPRHECAVARRRPGRDARRPHRRRADTTAAATHMSTHDPLPTVPAGVPAAPRRWRRRSSCAPPRRPRTRGLMRRRLRHLRSARPGPPMALAESRKPGNVRRSAASSAGAATASVSQSMTASRPSGRRIRLSGENPLWTTRRGARMSGPTMPASRSRQGRSGANARGAASGSGAVDGSPSRAAAMARRRRSVSRVIRSKSLWYASARSMP